MAHYIGLEESVFVKDKLFAFLLVKVIIVEALSTESGTRLGADHVQETCSGNGVKFIALFADKRPFK